MQTASDSHFAGCNLLCTYLYKPSPIMSSELTLRWLLSHILSVQAVPRLPWFSHHTHGLTQLSHTLTNMDSNRKRWRWLYGKCVHYKQLLYFFCCMKLWVSTIPLYLACCCTKFVFKLLHYNSSTKLLPLHVSCTRACITRSHTYAACFMYMCMHNQITCTNLHSL